MEHGVGSEGPDGGPTSMGGGARATSSRLLRAGRAILREALETGKKETAGRVGGVAEVLEDAARRLEDEKVPGGPAMMRAGAGAARRLADGVRAADVEGLAARARSAAASRPILLATACLALGFAAVRVARS